MSGDQWDFFNNFNKKPMDKVDNDFGTFKPIDFRPNSKNNIPKMVPQPSGIPWSIAGMSWGSSGNHNYPIEFTASPLDRSKSLNNPNCKRKAETESAVPRKQLITEEKMAASFDGMHLSGDYTVHNISNGENDGNMDLEFQGPRIVLSPELMKVKPEPILPPSILSKFEQPCTSLVLWRPPKKILQTFEENKDPNNNPEENGRRNKQRRGVLGSMADDYGNSKASTSSDSRNQNSCMDVEM